MDDKYRLLIRALIMPRSWRLADGLESPHEDRDTILDAGIKRFDEIFTQNMVLRAAQGAADEAMVVTAKKLQDKRKRSSDGL